MRKLKIYTYPYLLWMFLLVVIPTIIMLVLALTDLNLFKINGFHVTLEHLSILTEKRIKVALWNSIRLAAISSFICLIIGYPVAYFLSTLKKSHKGLFVSLLILPVWSNMLLRIIAWETLFYEESILNMFGISLDLIGKDIAIVIAMVSMYLPFMILPIYSVLEKIDQSLLEASYDLGATKRKTFMKITLPLTMGGIVSGIIMTLLPAMTAFALPERLSGGNTLLIGNVIEEYFKKYSNYNEGSVLSFVLLILIVSMYYIVLKFDKEGETLI